MLHLSRTPSWPWHTVVVTVTWTAHCLQCRLIEGVLVCHVCPDPLWRLASVPNGPHTPVELTRDVFDQRLITVHLDVTEQTV